MRFAALLAACLALVRGGTVLAGAAELAVQDAWVRAVPGAEVAAVYLTLRNSGAQPLVIVAVRSPRASDAMIHESAVTAGRATMRPRERLVVPPGETVRLAPGGLHIMLHLTGALTPGETVPVTLELAGGASVTVTAQVRALGAG
ncbi:MAG: copper chaperone PCu(A)C [Gammaproteobacteria bacterium]|nr:copper chaperone PCu(A)C [Gammaproteobacteria bacterium]